jgi:hypothetical protein
MISVKKTLQKIWLACLFNLLLATAVMAQTNLAGIAGKVSDSGGTLLANATITVKNESTGFVIKASSNSKGTFLLKELPLGSPYSITVEVIGMAAQKQTGYALNQGDLLQVSFSMADKVQELNVVEITSATLRNKIENIGSSTAVTAKDIAKLPVNGRNFSSLADLSPLSSGSSLGGQLAIGN